MSNKESLINEIAKHICRAVCADPNVFIHCWGKSEDCMGETFVPEAENVLTAVKNMPF